VRIIALEEAFLHPSLRELYPAPYVKLLDRVKANLTATQSPGHAADELERTVAELGFKGALINGHTHGLHLDDISFSPIFDRAQRLDVPIYIHPADPPPEIMSTYYKDYPALAQSWGWMVETGTHLLRLISGGVFDRYPDLRIIIGHMGELIPFGLDRLNRALTLGNWMLAQQSMQENLRYYMRRNVFITTSGVFDQRALNWRTGTRNGSSGCGPAGNRRPGQGIFCSRFQPEPNRQWRAHCCRSSSASPPPQ
jgi:Amidohydrolase